ncbi:MAG: hypothetical protein MUC33_21760 [Desulfobacterales bacterium]|nr:hypothetical protein [Desulfobacterales bacterium]
MKTLIGFAQARDLTLASVAPGGTEERPLLEAAGRTLAQDLTALVDSPSISTSRKDGYAVCPQDVKAASSAAPVRLRLVGRLSAGDMRPVRMNPGEAIRVTTGALIPDGAQAVISEEYCRTDGDGVLCCNTADPGRNVLPVGTDVRVGEPIASRGAELTPALATWSKSAPGSRCTGSLSKPPSSPTGRRPFARLFRAADRLRTSSSPAAAPGAARRTSSSRW